MAKEKPQKYDMRIAKSDAKVPQTVRGVQVEPAVANAGGVFAGMRYRKLQKNLEALQEKIDAETRVLDSLQARARAGSALLDLDTILKTDSVNRQNELLRAEEEQRELLRNADRHDHEYDEELASRGKTVQIKEHELQLRELELQYKTAEHEMMLLELEMKRESMTANRNSTLLQEQAISDAAKRERYAGVYGHVEELETEVITDRRRYSIFLQWYTARVHAVGGKQQVIILSAHPKIKHVFRKWRNLPRVMKHEALFRNLRGKQVEELRYGTPVIRYRGGIISHDDPPVMTCAAYKTDSGFRLVWMCNREDVSITCTRYRHSLRGSQVFRITNQSVFEPQIWDDEHYDDIFYYQFTVADGLLTFPLYCSKQVDKGLSKLDVEANRVIDEYLRGKKTLEDRERFLLKLRAIGAARGLTEDELEAVIQAYLDDDEDTTFFDSALNPDEDA